MILRNDKRQIADNILKYGNTFEAITFLLPNGDVYMEEPYKRQLDLTQPFLGDAIVCAATGERVAVISVPIYEGQITVRDMNRCIEC
jgi:hypothetical protein